MEDGRGLDGSGFGLEASRHRHPNNQAVEEWTKFIDQCVAKRLDPDKFGSFVSILHAQHPLPPSIVTDLLLRPQPTNQECLDPRIPLWLQRLVDQKLVHSSAILNALYKYSTSHKQVHTQAAIHGVGTVQTPTDLTWRCSYGQEEYLFYRLTKAVSLGTGITSAGNALEVCKIMAKWMDLFTAAAASFASDNIIGQMQSRQTRDEMETSRAAFVMLLLSICENSIVLNTLSQPFAKEARRALSDNLSNFVPSIMQNASQIAGRLEYFRTETLAGFEPRDKRKDAAKADLEDLLNSSLGLDSYVISELPTANSRAGLYIYFNALMVGRPLVDDASLYNYLHNRYNGNIEATAIGLILTSFDVLANATVSKKGQKAGHLLKSFLINKVPVLLATLQTSMFPPVTAEICISQALSQVDTTAFPTLSAMFDSATDNPITDTARQDFCFACCLHGLIPEPSIEGLLGEITYQVLPPGGRYVKDALVAECLVDPEKIQRLIRDMELMDGNVGAICQALTEVIARLCATKETMSLKALCGQLAKNPLSLDVMLLFEKPITILHPLCDLLDNWRYEEDQGEYQPVYEEFGSILLMVLAFVHRHNLNPADLGVRVPDSFVAKLLSFGHLSKPLEELSDQEKSHLNGWILGLFDTDSGGGLGDELMSSCPPQDFYLLTSSLFYQIVLALSIDHLGEESLKIGVEYLVDTFLLPSLVMAITYLANHLKATRNNQQQAVLRILQLILLTRQGSNEAQSMLSAVVNIVAKPLEHALRSYQRQDPKNQQVEPLLAAIRDNIRVSRRTAGAEHGELEGWTSTLNGGLRAALRHTMQELLQWSMHVGSVMPPSYTHRQILATLKILGPKQTLQVILEEIKHQTSIGNGPLVYDIATALVCAPDIYNIQPPPPPALPGGQGQDLPPPIQLRLGLREVLRMQAFEFKKLQKTDLDMAEHTLRLSRKVELQMAVPQAAEILQAEILQGDLSLELGGNEATSLGNTLATAAQGDAMMTDEENLGLDLSGAASTDLGLSSGGGAGLGLGTDNDLFGMGEVGGVGGSDLLEAWEGMGEL